MATIAKGILGQIRGTIGTATGSTWNGVDYIRSRPGKRTKEATLLQKQQQARFQLISVFLRCFFNLAMLGFKQLAVRQTGFNAAMSYNLKHAVTGTYPDFEIDYAQVMFSKGSLPEVLNPAAVSTAAGKVKFTWSNNAGTGNAKDNDKALLLIYCPVKNQAVYTTGSATRNAATETLTVTEFAGLEVHTWMGFVAENGKLASNSSYTGMLTVS